MGLSTYRCGPWRRNPPSSSISRHTTVQQRGRASGTVHCTPHVAAPMPADFKALSCFVFGSGSACVCSPSVAPPRDGGGVMGGGGRAAARAPGGAASRAASAHRGSPDGGGGFTPQDDEGTGTCLSGSGAVARRRLATSAGACRTAHAPALSFSVLVGAARACVSASWVCFFLFFFRFGRGGCGCTTETGKRTRQQVGCPVRGSLCTREHRGTRRLGGRSASLGTATAAGGEPGACYRRPRARTPGACSRRRRVAAAGRGRPVPPMRSGSPLATAPRRVRLPNKISADTPFLARPLSPPP